ncbi:YHS domain-containing protein [Limnoglobus roseus]|uniref:YHS domain-containing protein n=1 Tax=Limnoglobus roseus TaxID=2598579 RepID=A0A5C1AIL7_9BACT|nr:YHS domain-containing protein [Limnoglobus roseus]QEL18495.1 YHS domain-containing protein [Limnoglobus roseus]
MNRRLLLVPALLAGMFFGLATADDKANAAKAKKALQDVGEFIGQWNLDARPAKGSSWKETATWGWKFKKDDSWIEIEVKDGKAFTKGELKYLVDKKLYELTTTDKDKKTQVYTGDFKRGVLKLEGKDPKTGDAHRLTINTLSEGVRMAMNFEEQPGGKGLFTDVYKATGTKEGESFAGGTASKKPECVVTGGIGTMAVSYNGKTYYVCCSGCRDEFNDNPKKYVDAFEKKNK